MWDERYAEPGYAYGKEPNEFVRAMADWLPAGPVLCLAEGEGRNATYLAGRGHAVTAVDSSAVGLTKAVALAVERDTTMITVHADLADYVIEPGAWAGIVCVFCHLPPALRDRVLKGAVEGLRTGGVLLFEAYGPAQLALGTGGPKDPALLASLADLRPLLEGLELVYAEEVTREIHEGRFHDGPGATVEIVGVKR
ncbi:MAG: class I SAM-dependent methyltransferase [Polyangiaceae bacterium]|nr:class I SAM-dependent methyltransferase [Polyangiaceae bacterium]